MLRPCLGKSLKKKKIICAITMGDPAGIGPEVIAKALSDPEILRLADFLVIGDKGVLERYLKSPLQNAASSQAIRTGNSKIQILDLHNLPRYIALGKIRPEYGRASLEYLKTGLELAVAGSIDCLVTAPVCKKSVNLAGYQFTGHTEYISKICCARDTVMLVVNKKLKVALVTRHIALKDAAGGLSCQKIYRVIKTTASGLGSLFAIKKPRLGVCGLNPHASDGGILGNEEERLIQPAINKARKIGISVEGPFSADTIFLKALAGSYDTVICMYHDQGLIPLKLSGFSEAVNITLGLPFVRTSPGHGTAFDIAGKNKANPQSFGQAIRVAIKCTQNQKKP